MTNHVHLIVQASDNLTAIPKLMNRPAGRQTRFVNALEKRSGSLWKGRYKISQIDIDVYLSACCRYVELNPVKAEMVKKLSCMSAPRVEAYRQFVEQEIGSSSDELIRAAINSNKLTGGKKFVDGVENCTGIRFGNRKEGRTLPKR